MKIMEKIKALMKDKAQLRELILYVVFGVATTVVNIAVYWAATELMGIEGIDQATQAAAYYAVNTIGQVIAWIVAVLFAYFTNRKFVFQSTTSRETGAWREFWQFVSARLASLVLLETLLFNGLLATGMNRMWVKLLVNVLVVVFNYVASRFVVFAKKTPEKQQGKK